MQPVKITVKSNGCLSLSGEVEIVDAQGQPYNLQGRKTLGLCRCGLSANKPFCDGAHKGKFEHEAVAFALPPKKES